jgi:hypothetical protein
VTRILPWQAKESTKGAVCHRHMEVKRAIRRVANTHSIRAATRSLGHNRFRLVLCYTPLRNASTLSVCNIPKTDVLMTWNTIRALCLLTSLVLSPCVSYATDRRPTIVANDNRSPAGELRDGSSLSVLNLARGSGNSRVRKAKPSPCTPSANGDRNEKYD